MRRPIVCLFLIVGLIVARGATVTAAPRPPAPPPPAQGTITITWTGSGSGPVGQYGTQTINIEHREVVHITAGTYDQAAGTMDLVGFATATSSFHSEYESQIERTYQCLSGWLWRRWENEFVRNDMKASGTYDANAHRYVTMSSRSQGLLHFGHYPGTHPTIQNWDSMPNANGEQYRRNWSEFISMDEGCFPPRGQGEDFMTESTLPAVNTTMVFPDFWTSPVPALPVTLSRKGRLTGGDTLVVNFNPQYANIPVAVTIDVDVTFGAGLIADAGGPYTTERGQPVTLDASASRTADGVAIRSYAWSWVTDNDCGIATLRNSSAPATASPTRPTTALCGLTVTLTVTDAKRRTDTATTWIAVRPREGQFASTPFSSTTSVGIPEKYGGDKVPVASGDWIGAANAAACPNPPPPAIYEPWICPAATNGGSPTWVDNGGYTMGDVSDPGGPFDGFAWITGTQLVADRVIYVNSYLRPDGPSPSSLVDNFYTANLNAGYPVTEFLTRMEEHEGDGPSWNPGGGHSGRLKLAFKRNGSDGRPMDPRRRIEPLFAINREQLKTLTDGALVANEMELCLATADPLPVIWSGTILQWDPGLLFGSWVPTPITVGGAGTVDCSQ